ncbi:MAG TPA: hypothetical protein VHD83_17395 [Puia sp.]|nr:hypothetical protein [Puia sp.]
MSNVNDNNLDDLLRRAAEKYPLRTDSADWGKLVADLDKDPSLILPPVNAEGGRRRRRFFWLFLLLPLAGIGYYAWHAAGKQSSLAEQTSVVAGKDAAVSTGKDEVGPTGKGAGVTETNKPVGRIGQASVSTGKEGQSPAVGADVPTAQGEQSGQARVQAEQGGHVGRETGGQEKHDGVRTAKQGGHVGGESTQPAGEKVGQNGEANIGATIGKEGRIKTSAPAGRGGHAGGEGQDERELHLASNNMQRASTRGKVAVNFPVKDNTKKDNKDNDKIKLQKPKSFFYAGIIGSPDLSTVKMQSVKNVGTKFGLLLGYSFNSRWSIESGVYYSKKKYYTDGEYFDKTNANPYNVLKYVDQLKIDGVCNMWQIPVNVRYNLSTGEKTRWFATAGVSAYYMAREKYDCTGYLYGNPWAKNWDNKPTRDSWSANINLSVGYEQRLGKIGNLRLEPYVGVPMSGIGTGKLSIMSAGLNIGITRKLW